MKIKVVNISGNPLPDYSTIHSAGMDIRANLNEVVTLKPLERILIKTGLFIQLPEGYEAQIRPRSGLALKNGITVLNSPGTIDADYRGEVGVILVNLSDTPFEIKNGDRIAQMIISKYERAEMVRVETLDSSERGSGGFGHTGKG
jgi:dUTP pyrophosphatase